MRDVEGENDDRLVSMHHRIPSRLRHRLKHAAVDRDVPATDLVNSAVDLYLDLLDAAGECESLKADYWVLPSAVRRLSYVAGLPIPPRLTLALLRLPKDELAILLSAAGAAADLRRSGADLEERLVDAIRETSSTDHPTH